RRRNAVKTIEQFQFQPKSKQGEGHHQQAGDIVKDAVGHLTPSETWANPVATIRIRFINTAIGTALQKMTTRPAMGRRSSRRAIAVDRAKKATSRPRPLQASSTPMR